MRTNALAWAAAAVLCAATAGPASAEEGARCTWQEGSRIRILVHDLGSEDPATRQAAERALRAYGPKAHVALREAATHENPDVRYRATHILHGDGFDVGSSRGWVVWHEGLRVEMLPNRVRVLSPDGRPFEAASIEDLRQRHPELATRLRTLRIEPLDARADAGFDDRRGMDRLGDDRLAGARDRDGRLAGTPDADRDRMGFAGRSDPADRRTGDDRGVGAATDRSRTGAGAGSQDDRYGSSPGRDLRNDPDDRSGAGAGATAGTGDRYGPGSGATTGAGDRSGAGAASQGDRYGAGSGTPGTGTGTQDDRSAAGSTRETGPFGLQVRDLDDATRREKNLAGHQGVYVVTVEPQSTAMRLGLRSGDLVTSVNGQAVRSSNDLATRLRDLGDQERLTVVVVREGETRTLNR